STMVSPGFNAPDFKADCTIARPMRSLTLPPGFIISTLPNRSTLAPPRIRSSRTSGVRPIQSRMLFLTGMVAPAFWILDLYTEEYITRSILIYSAGIRAQRHSVLGAHR